MNLVVLTGRLTREPEIRATQNGGTVCNFTLAIDRPMQQNGEKQTDFPRITVFGKQAENCGKYLAKGLLCTVQGKLQTGSYQNKDGVTVYTTDVIADKVEFLEWKDKRQGQPAQQQAYQGQPAPQAYQGMPAPQQAYQGQPAQQAYQGQPAPQQAYQGQPAPQAYQGQPAPQQGFQSQPAQQQMNMAQTSYAPIDDDQEF